MLVKRISRILLQDENCWTNRESEKHLFLEIPTFSRGEIVKLLYDFL